MSLRSMMTDLILGNPATAAPLALVTVMGMHDRRSGGRGVMSRCAARGGWKATIVVRHVSSAPNAEMPGARRRFHSDVALGIVVVGGDAAGSHQRPVDVTTVDIADAECVTTLVHPFRYASDGISCNHGFQGRRSDVAAPLFDPGVATHPAGLRSDDADEAYAVTAGDEGIAGNDKSVVDDHRCRGRVFSRAGTSRRRKNQQHRRQESDSAHYSPPFIQKGASTYACIVFPLANIANSPIIAKEDFSRFKPPLSQPCSSLLNREAGQ